MGLHPPEDRVLLHRRLELLWIVGEPATVDHAPGVGNANSLGDGRHCLGMVSTDDLDRHSLPREVAEDVGSVGPDLVAESDEGSRLEVRGELLLCESGIAPSEHEHSFAA